ncbi:MAG: ATP-dependent DNA ligase [Actinobacteria bacterium]|nr:ATP-dependent DNA ligase [Actinomycetota bacterium]
MTVTLATKPMLAKLQDDVPEGDGWSYEPKWDGFRTLIHRRGDSLDIISRDARPMNRYFPELVALLTEELTTDCVLDGEIVVAIEDGLSFGGLQMRIHPAESRVRMLSAEVPASVLLFDVLALDDEVMDRPLSERLALLDEHFGAPRSIDEVLARVASSSPLLTTTPRTSDAAEARTWLTRYEDKGLDGVVAKKLADTYQPNKRSLVKVKRKRTCECVVGGYRLSKDGGGVGSLLLGLYTDDGVLQYVGHTSGFKANERVELLERLREFEGGGGFGEGRTPGGQSRWSSGKDASWFPLIPVLVCEVAYDRMMDGRFRHAVGFVRWRADKNPEDCDYNQAL